MVDREPRQNRRERTVDVDDVEALASAIRDLVSHTALVIVSGGLGPTADDVTREAAARALGRGLTRDPAITERLRERYRVRGRQFPEVAARMADACGAQSGMITPR